MSTEVTQWVRFDGGAEGQIVEIRGEVLHIAEREYEGAPARQIVSRLPHQVVPIARATRQHPPAPFEPMTIRQEGRSPWLFMLWCQVTEFFKRG